MNSCQNCPVFQKSIFATNGNEDFIKNEKLKSQKSLKKGESLFSHSADSNGIYCIKNGSVKIIKTDSGGNETIVRIANPGDIIGDDMLFGDQTPEKSASAITNLEVCYIDKSIFNDLLKDNEISLNLLRKNFKIVNKAETHICSCHWKKVIGRLAEFLIEIKNTEGIYENNLWCINLNFNREEIATIVGTAPETIIRSISELKKMGIISGQRRIIINDEKKLENIAFEKNIVN
jgi:CRP-like cAMP-binding protein